MPAPIDLNRAGSQPAQRRRFGAGAWRSVALRSLRDHHAVAEADQKVDVGDAPDQPGEEAAQVDPAKVDDSGLAPDGGKIAVVAIANGPNCSAPRKRALISVPT